MSLWTSIINNESQLDQADMTSLFLPSDGNLLLRTLAYIHRNSIQTEHYEAIGSGAIVASLLYIGLPPDKIASLLLDSDVLNQKSLGLREEIERIIGLAAEEVYGMIPSMDELCALKGSGSLHLYVFNTTTQRIDVLNYVRTPDLSIVTACSMAHNLGSAYYEHTYCGNVYTSVGVRFPKIVGGPSRLCIHTRSTYIDGPSNSEEYADLELNTVRTSLIDSTCILYGIALTTLEACVPPWDHSRETKLSLLL